MRDNNYSGQNEEISFLEQIIALESAKGFKRADEKETFSKMLEYESVSDQITYCISQGLLPRSFFCSSLIEAELYDYINESPKGFNRYLKSLSKAVNKLKENDLREGNIVAKKLRKLFTKPHIARDGIAKKWNYFNSEEIKKATHSHLNGESRYDEYIQTLEDITAPTNSKIIKALCFIFGKPWHTEVYHLVHFENYFIKHPDEQTSEIKYFLDMRMSELVYKMLSEDDTFRFDIHSRQKLMSRTRSEVQKIYTT